MNLKQNTKIKIPEKFIPLNKESVSKLKLAIPSDVPIYIFDIDETLYPPNDTIKKTRRRNYINFLKTKGFDEEKASKIISEFSDKYGAAIKGFVHEHNVLEDQYKKLIQIDSKDYNIFNFDHEGNKILSNLSGIKICLTNSGFHHSKLVLENIGLLNHIDFVFHCDYEDMNFVCKPQIDVYKMVEVICDLKEHHVIHFFDDKLVNIETAKKLGWNAYHVTISKNYKHFLEKLLSE